MHVENGVDLVSAGARLVHALAEQRHHLAGGGEPGEELGEIGFRHVAQRCRGGDIRGLPVGGGDRFVAGVKSQLCQQAAEQRDIGARAQCQMQVGTLAGGGAAWVDHHQAHLWPSGAGGENALVDDRMAPGGVGADEHNHVGQFEILVDPGDDILAEGSLVAGYGACHAKA